MTSEIFLSEDRLLDFRTITTLLGITEPVEKRGSAPAGTKLLHLEDESSFKRHSGYLLYLKVSNLANVLVRADEVIAAVPAKSYTAQITLAVQPSAGSERDVEEEYELSRELLFTANPQRKVQQSVEVQDTEKQLQAEFTEGDTGLLDGLTHIGRLFAQKIKSEPKRRDHGITFSDHNLMLVTLLKRHHQATTEEEVRATYRKLCLYVIIASTNKIHGRLQRGIASGKPVAGRKNKRNFWEYLTKDVDEIYTANTQADDLEVDALSDDLPNAQQKVVLKGFFHVAPNLLNGAETDMAQPVYNALGRQRLQRVLRYSLMQANSSLIALNNAKGGLKECPQDEKELEKRTEILEKCALEALIRLGDLSDLRTAFRQHLEGHMQWLVAVFKIKLSTISPIYTTTGDKSESSSSKKRAGLSDIPEEEAASAVPTSDGPTSSADVPGSDPPYARTLSDEREEIPEPQQSEAPPPSSPPVASQSMHALQRENVQEEAQAELPVLLFDEPPEVIATDLEGLDLSAIDDEVFELDELLTEQEKGWPAAAAKYMQLICLHYNSIQELRKDAPSNGKAYQERVSEFIKGVTLKTLHIVPEPGNRKMTPMQDILGRLIPESNERELFTDYVNRAMPYLKGDLDKATFQGTYHCETLLLSLRAYQAVLPPISAPAATPTPSFAVSNDVLSTFKDMNESLLMVSKRCCPACERLIQLVREDLCNRRKEALIYPGAHVVWTNVALPAWLPKRYAEPIVDHAEKELRRRIGLFLELKSTNKKRKFRSPTEESTHGFGNPTEAIQCFEERRKLYG